MLTETEARELLTQAALTIDVDPVVRLVPAPSRSRRWVTVAAAAATAVVLGGVTVLAVTQGGPDRPLGHKPSPSVTPSSGTVLDTDQIPSVFGYDARSAQTMLESAGLAVTVQHRKLYCTGDDGRALATSPAVGSTFAPGDPVTLIVGKNQPVPCPSSPKPDQRAFAWALIDFANGRSTTPLTRTARVTLSVNGRSTVVSAKDFDDPATWPVCDSSTHESTCPGSALDVLRQASSAVLRLNDRWETPGLGVMGSDTRLRISVAVPVDGIVGPQWTITVDRVSTRPPAGAPAYSQWAISAVHLDWHSNG